MTSFREVWLGRKSQEDNSNVHKAECWKRSVHEEENRKLSLLAILPLLCLRLSTVACGGVFAPRMTQMHAVYPPIWHATFVTSRHASLWSLPSVSTVKDWEEHQKPPGSVQRQQFCLFLMSIVSFWIFFFKLWSIYLNRCYAAGIRSTSRPNHLRDKQEKSCGGAGNELPPPSPPGQGAFYIPPSISITIAATRPRARHNVDGSEERASAQALEWGTCSLKRLIGADMTDPLRAPLPSKREKRGWRVERRKRVSGVKSKRRQYRLRLVLKITIAVSHWCEWQHNWRNQEEPGGTRRNQEEPGGKRRVHGRCELIMTTTQARQPVTHEQQHHGNTQGEKKGATRITRRDGQRRNVARNQQKEEEETKERIELSHSTLGE